VNTFADLASSSKKITIDSREGSMRGEDVRRAAKTTTNYDESELAACLDRARRGAGGRGAKNGAPARTAPRRSSSSRRRSTLSRTERSRAIRIGNEHARSSPDDSVKVITSVTPARALLGSLEPSSAISRARSTSSRGLEEISSGLLPFSAVLVRLSAIEAFTTSSRLLVLSPSAARFPLKLVFAGRNPAFCMRPLHVGDLVRVLAVAIAVRRFLVEHLRVEAAMFS